MEYQVDVCITVRPKDQFGNELRLSDTYRVELKGLADVSGFLVRLHELSLELLNIAPKGRK